MLVGAGGSHVFKLTEEVEEVKHLCGHAWGGEEEEEVASSSSGGTHVRLA